MIPWEECVAVLAGAGALAMALSKNLIQFRLALKNRAGRSRHEADRYLIYLGNVVLWGLAIAGAGEAAAKELVPASLLVMAGGALSIAALLALDTDHNENIEPLPGATLRSRGIYGVTRHPMRLGFALECSGLALVSPGPASYPVLASTLLLLLFRTLREERFLIKHYGDAYREYQSEVGWLPFSRTRR